MLLASFESERAGHAATAGVGVLDIESHASQHCFFRSEFHDRCVMTMRLHERFSFERRQFHLFALEKFAQRHRRLRELLRVRIIRIKIVKLVAENGNATRLESDDRDSFIELGAQCVDRLAQRALRHSEKSPVVERTSAADAFARNGDVIAGRFEDFGGGHGRLGMKVIVESVGPQHDARVRLRAVR